MKQLVLAAVVLFGGGAFAGDGRYQVVNPTPQFAENAMLLDTQTGQTWLLCTAPGGEKRWCPMKKSTGPAGPRVAKANLDAAFEAEVPLKE